MDPSAVNLSAIRENTLLTDHYFHLSTSGDGVAHMRAREHMEMVYYEEPVIELHTNLPVYHGWCGNRENQSQPDEDLYWPQDK